MRECTPLTRGCATLARGTCEPSGFRPGPRTAAKRTSVHGFANKQATRFSPSSAILGSLAESILRDWDGRRQWIYRREQGRTERFLAPARRKSQMRWKGQEPSADHTWVYCDIHSFCLSARQLPASRKPGSTPVSGGFAAGLSVGGCVKGAIASGVLIANPVTPAIRIWHRCCFVSRRPPLLFPKACLSVTFAHPYYKQSQCGRARMSLQPLSVKRFLIH